jgi:hypothetical protein
VDESLAALVRNRNFNPCNCSISAALPFVSESAEKSWARSAISSAIAADPSLLKTTAEGQYVAIRPANKQAVYAMSWVPSRAAAKKSRLVKSEYLFAPYKPGNAVVTEGDLTFSGSVTIQAAGADPNAFVAPVHTDGNSEQRLHQRHCYVERQLPDGLEQRRCWIWRQRSPGDGAFCRPAGRVQPRVE